LYKHIGSGLLRPRKLDKRLVVLLEDLETWLKNLPQAEIVVAPPKMAA
jgi:hypothetical protein